jgi:hypothetical protein
VSDLTCSVVFGIYLLAHEISFYCPTGRHRVGLFFWANLLIGAPNLSHKHLVGFFADGLAEKFALRDAQSSSGCFPAPNVGVGEAKRT